METKERFSMIIQITHRHYSPCDPDDSISSAFASCLTWKISEGDYNKLIDYVKKFGSTVGGGVVYIFNVHSGQWISFNVTHAISHLTDNHGLAIWFNADGYRLQQRSLDDAWREFNKKPIKVFVNKFTAKEVKQWRHSVSRY